MKTTKLFLIFVAAAIIVFINDASAIRSVRLIGGSIAGWSRPIYATAPINDFDRFFVLEQYCARIRILRLATNVLDSRPFLTLDSLVAGSCTMNPGLERGLLGLVFHPNYAENGYFYVYYTATSSGNQVLARYQVSSTDPDSADVNSALIMLNLPQPNIHHKGGSLIFGPNDGYLYVSMGDGEDPGDPDNNAQNDSSFLGKILRLDVDGELPYEIPPDNPFVHPDSLQLDEIWAKGLRNPWRVTFDRLTGDMYIGDVGQGTWEELDFQLAASTGGENYGWRCWEGLHCTGAPSRPECNCLDSAFFVHPVYEYHHGGSPFFCSITGGYVYRGCAIPEIQGRYFFADYCSNQIFSMRIVDGDTVDLQNHTTELAPGGSYSISTISSFAEDANGELYIFDRDGFELFKIVPDTVYDCNENGVNDECDIANGTSDDENDNGIPDECDCGYGTVDNLTIISSDTDIVLNWTALDVGEIGYSIYRSNLSSAPFPGIDWSEIAANLPPPGAPLPMSYTDAGIAVDSLSRFYMVTYECEDSER